MVRPGHEIDEGVGQVELEAAELSQLLDEVREVLSHQPVAPWQQAVGEAVLADAPPVPLPRLVGPGRDRSRIPVDDDHVMAVGRQHQRGRAAAEPCPDDDHLGHRASLGST
jgi:hypothetical protein